MHFGSLGNPGSRVRGRPFKLFSDELPTVAFNKAALAEFGKEIDRENGRHVSTYKKYSKDRQRRIDTVSLPSLASPMSDTQSSSSGSRAKSEATGKLGPDIESTRKDIQKRLGLKDPTKRPDDSMETKNNVGVVNGWGSPEFGHQGYGGIPYLSEQRNASREHQSTSTQKSREARKSILQELLSEARKTKHKCRRVMDIGQTASNTKHKNSVENAQAEISNDMFVKEDKLLHPRVGILKQSSLEQRQSPCFGVKESRLKTEHVTDTRLSEDQTSSTPNVSSDSPRAQFQNDPDVRVTVHVSAPRRHPNQFVLAGPAASMQQRQARRKVNFAEYASDSAAGYEQETRSPKIKHENKTKSSQILGIQEYRSSNAHSKNDTQYKTAGRKLKRSRSTANKLPSKNKTLDNKETNFRQQHQHTGVMFYDTYSMDDKSELQTLGRWKPMEKPWNEVSNTNTTKYMATISPLALQNPDDRKTGASSPYTGKGKESKQINGVSRIKDIATPTRKDSTDSSDLEEGSELGEFLETIDVEELPEEIDRTLTGAELIRVYRLWDRKRKAFPGGLRKIEAPAQREQQILLPEFKQFKHLKFEKNDVEETETFIEGADAINKVLVNSF